MGSELKTASEILLQLKKLKYKKVPFSTDVFSNTYYYNSKRTNKHDKSVRKVCNSYNNSLAKGTMLLSCDTFFDIAPLVRDSKVLKFGPKKYHLNIYQWVGEDEYDMITYNIFDNSLQIVLDECNNDGEVVIYDGKSQYISNEDLFNLNLQYPMSDIITNENLKKFREVMRKKKSGVYIYGLND